MTLSESICDTATATPVSTAAGLTRPVLSSPSTREGDRIVLCLRGEHDVATVAELSETMAKAISMDASDIVIDLSEVEFMGAATVGVLVRGRNYLRLRSRNLVVRDPSRLAARVLEVCDLSDLVEAPTSGALASWVEVPTESPVARQG